MYEAYTLQKEMYGTLAAVCIRFIMQTKPLLFVLECSLTSLQWQHTN